MNANYDISSLLHSISADNCEESYKSLFLLYHDRLVQFAYSILRSQEDAEEVASDFFINIWKNRKQLPQIENPKLFFFVSTKNLALNRIKAASRRPLPPVDEWNVKMGSIFFNPEDLMISSEFVKKIMACTNNLPPKCRLIFKLAKEEGLKYADISQLLGVSVKTIEAQMAIAFRRIRNCLSFENEFPEIHDLLNKKK